MVLWSPTLKSSMCARKSADEVEGLHKMPVWRNYITIIILVALLLEKDGEKDTLEPISCSQGLWTSGRPISSSQCGTSTLPPFRAAACGARRVSWCWGRLQERHRPTPFSALFMSEAEVMW
jgi:hypothetical protein